MSDGTKSERNFPFLEFFAFRVEYVRVSEVFLGFSGMGINSKDLSGKIGPLIPLLQ